MKKFEYKTLEVDVSYKLSSSSDLNSKDLEEDLNRLGEEGWELITLLPRPSTQILSKFTLLLKREK